MSNTGALPKPPIPLPPGSGILTRGARQGASAPRAERNGSPIGGARREPVPGARKRATGGREAGRAGRGREEEVRDPSPSARPAQRYGAGLHPPQPPALRPSPPLAARRPGEPRTPGASRGPSFVATTSAARGARAHAHSHAQAGTAEVKWRRSCPLGVVSGWVRSSPGRSARGPAATVPTCFSAPAGREGRTPARSPRAGHAFPGGSHEFGAGGRRAQSW